MEKQILMEYIDACELIRETEQDIQRLKRKKSETVQGSVKGSNMNTIPIRMQRIIRYKYFEGMSWEQVADRIGRMATGDSVRMEVDRFLKEK